MKKKKKQNRHLNALPAGVELHWYEIRDILGQGGFGITYLAYDKNLAHEVAIKEYLPAELAVRAADGTVAPVTPDLEERYRWGLDRFIDEARTLGQFKHPNIVRVRNVFELNNTAYMIMDYELGESLQDILTRRKILDEADIKTVIFPIIEGMKQVHAHGFIHRDIKPANIFIRMDGDPVLLDFGSARQALVETRNAMTGVFSKGYAPIEQYSTTDSDDTQGPWTDIYALGATLYRAIAGIPPTDAIDRSSALGVTSRDTYVAAVEIGAGRYSPAILEAIDYAMRFDREQRPQNITEWLSTFNDKPAAETGSGDSPPGDELIQTIIKAENGDVAAQASLAYIYAKGIDTDKDEAEAAKWFHRAAEQGNINAMYNLGVMYAKGRGINQDYRESFHWYSEAAVHGDAEAQATLYMMYMKGIGVERDESSAYDWCLLAARQGHLNSMYRLGEMYWRGHGVDRDAGEAFSWFRRAAEKGHVNAQLHLAYMYGKGQGIKRNDLEAYNWYRRAAEAGHPQAQYNLGVIFAKGRGIERNPEEARHWYQKAADQGYENAVEALGRLNGSN